MPARWCTPSPMRCRPPPTAMREPSASCRAAKRETDGHGAGPASAEASHSHLGPFPLRPVPTWSRRRPKHCAQCATNVPCLLHDASRRQRTGCGSRAGPAGKGRQRGGAGRYGTCICLSWTFTTAFDWRDELCSSCVMPHGGIRCALHDAGLYDAACSMDLCCAHVAIAIARWHTSACVRLPRGACCATVCTEIRVGIYQVRGTHFTRCVTVRE